jgi:nucleoside-diphosphate-sugar epimerase
MARRHLALTNQRSFPMSTQKTALVLGATGNYGSHAVQALLKHGWRVRALARNPQAAAAKAGQRTPIEWIKGDAMNQADVVAAARGVSVIVHAVNPPAYKNWPGLVLPMTRATIAAAKAEGARIVVPGNVYNYAPDAGPAITEDAPQAPVTRKGKIRVEMEEMLRLATADGVKVLIVRAGDFFSGLSWIVTRSKGRVRSMYRAGPAAVGHLWAYLPDMAEATARLLDREADLADFEVFNFKGHWLDRSDAMIAAVGRVVGQPKLPVHGFPWIVVYMLSPFVETFRELLEMRYLQQKPIGLDNAKLVAFLGGEPHTPLDTAVGAALEEMGCLAEPPAAHALVPACA